MEDCVMCSDAITNPICPACLKQGVQQWLMEQGEEKLAREVMDLTSCIFANSGTMHCIRCNRMMELCAYCYTKEVFHVIKQHYWLVADYLTYFNFDLEHLGWEQEARRYIDSEE